RPWPDRDASPTARSSARPAEGRGPPQGSRGGSNVSLRPAACAAEDGVAPSASQPFIAISRILTASIFWGRSEWEGVMRENRPGRVIALLGVIVATIASTAVAGLPPWQPSITSISPSFGRPQGGQVVTISGRDFQAPVRVLLTIGDKSIEAFIVSITPTQVTIVTPAVDLASGQQLKADVTVLTQAGTVNETMTRAP